MRDTLLILAIAVLFGCLFWVADAVYEYYMFSQDLRFMLFQEPMSFWDSLLLNVPASSILERLVFLVACLAGGSLAAWLVSRNKATRRQAHVHQRRYEAYVSNAPEAICVVDTEGTIQETNPAMAELVGQDQPALKGQDLYRLIDSEERENVAGKIRELQPQETLQTEAQICGEDGSICRIILSASRISPEQRILFLRDITELRQLQEQLQQSQKLESLGRLAGGIAHDFNNLLTGIMGNAQMIQLEPDQPEHLLTEQAEEIVSAAGRAADLTRQLLGFARKGRLTTAPVNLHDTVDEVFNLLAHSIDKRIELQRDLQAREHCVLGDPTQMQNALLNLGVNARDAMPDGGRLTFSTRNVQLDERYCRSVAEDIEPGPYLELCVTDTGEGMDETTRQQIFEPFFTTKEAGRGTGLGLASVYGAVQSHKGLIRVYSQPGRGTTMKLLLPVCQADLPRDSDNDRQDIEPGRGRILLIDDEQVVLKFAGNALREIGYDVVTCDSGKEGVETVKRDPALDLVILDLIMPGLSGSETYTRIRQVRDDLPVIISTGYSSRQALESTLQQGAQGFLPKPYRIEELSRIVARQLDAAQAQPSGD
jgi:PAS domain S-box-containing protein